MCNFASLSLSLSLSLFPLARLTPTKQISKYCVHVTCSRGHPQLQPIVEKLSSNFDFARTCFSGFATATAVLKSLLAMLVNVEFMHYVALPISCQGLFPLLCALRCSTLAVCCGFSRLVSFAMCFSLHYVGNLLRAFASGLVVNYIFFAVFDVGAQLPVSATCIAANSLCFAVWLCCLLCSRCGATVAVLVFSKTSTRFRSAQQATIKNTRRGGQLRSPW
jgi:hypothetical protein